MRRTELASGVGPGILVENAAAVQRTARETKLVLIVSIPTSHVTSPEWS